MNYIYIACTLFFTLYGQLVIKWRINVIGQEPVSVTDKFGYVITLLQSPWVISGFVSAFLAAVSWMLALSHFPLSYAYPFMSLSFILVPFFSALFFKEVIQVPQLVGLFFIVLGVIIGSKR